jgi:vacuolar protein sorting-associated protein 54
VEGVSDKDYIAHASKHAAMQQQRKSNGQLSEAGSSWTVYSAIQNLPAVLNDPFKGKQSNFLTRTWGDGFVEKVDIPKSPYLPEITMQHFEMYLKKIARVTIRLGDKCHLIVILHSLQMLFYILCFLFQRYRKHSRMNSNASRPTTPNELLQNFPNLRKVKSLGNVT